MEQSNYKNFFLKFDKIENGKSKRFLEVGDIPEYQTGMIIKKYKPREIVSLRYNSCNSIIKIAGELNKQKQLSGKITYINGSAENAGLIKSLGKFDVVYSIFSLQSWSNPVKSIENLCGALNEKGILFIYGFCRNELHYFLNAENKTQNIPDETGEIKQTLMNLEMNNNVTNLDELYMDLIIKKE